MKHHGFLTIQNISHYTCIMLGVVRRLNITERAQLLILKEQQTPQDNGRHLLFLKNNCQIGINKFLALAK